MFYTLQGEGLRAGRAAVFCRFSGCNLWSGREQDRAAAQCSFCDTDFVGTDGVNGGKFACADDLARAIAALWPHDQSGAPYVVLTGGEPALQVDDALVAALHTHGFEIAIETNGTQPLPHGIDWVCVSPKAGSSLVVTRGDELKLVFPQAGLPPDIFLGLEFQYFLIQPMDGPQAAENVQAAVTYCLDHPRWRLSLQTHKILGIA